MGNEGDHLIDKIGDTDSEIYKSILGERNKQFQTKRTQLSKMQVTSLNLMARNQQVHRGSGADDKVWKGEIVKTS